MAGTEGLLPTSVPTIASFPAADLADGTGYQAYFGMVGDNNENMVTPNSNMFSENVHTSATAANITTSFVEHINEDFDILFNLPRFARGKALINVPMGINHTSDTINYVWKAKVEIFHVNSGGTETSLGSGESREFVHLSGTGLQESFMALLDIDITGQHFKRGEIMRFTITGLIKTTSGATPNVTFGLGHDPAGRTDATYVVDTTPTTSLAIIDSATSTKMIFNVPFRSGD